MSSWWDRTDPTDRSELTNRAPAGLVESWWNVVAGAVLLIGLPVILLSGGFSPARIAFALFGLAIMVALELVFVRKLTRRIAGRRALRLVTADHEVPERAPLTIRPGDVVQVGARDTEWPAFVFVTTEHGTGWVPARHLDIDGSAGTVRVGYDTTELPASSGEIVDLVADDPESGWSWCRNADGREGWVPRRVLTAA